MAPDKIVEASIKGMRNDRFEIYPGLAKAIRILSRLTPKLLLAQASKMGGATVFGENIPEGISNKI